jgi:hypothetical protein
MPVTIKTALNADGFRAGLDSMRAEGARFRDSFRRTIEQGGGLFGAIDRGLGVLSSGRFAGPLAAIGAGMTALRGISDGLAKNWENIAAATDRARQNVEAIQTTREAVTGQRFAGDAATAATARDAAARAAEAAQAAREAGELGDPTTFRGASQTAVALNGGERNLSSFITMLRINAGRFGVPFFGQDFEAANDLFTERQQRAQQTRQEVDRTAQLRPFEEFRQRAEQRSGTAAQVAAEDRLGVAQGRTTGFEAAANALLLATQQFEDTRATFGENDPRTQQARAAATDAFTAYDNEITNARRFRNDPTIIADSLARLGGGGGVGVFGDGRGELLFEQKRLNQSISGLTQAMQTLNVTLSRTNLGGGDVD